MWHYFTTRCRTFCTPRAPKQTGSLQFLRHWGFFSPLGSKYLRQDSQPESRVFSVYFLCFNLFILNQGTVSSLGSGAVWQFDFSSLFFEKASGEPTQFAPWLFVYSMYPFFFQQSALFYWKLKAAPAAAALGGVFFLSCWHSWVGGESDSKFHLVQEPKFFQSSFTQKYFLFCLFLQFNAAFT